MRDVREQMNIVIVGHVDHGKSTVIGRLLADTGSLPQGKLAQVRHNCEVNSKPFEYAFLLDALKDEQSQGITIDVARCFFKTAKRHYIIIDAPGHIEFLKNMITGAARAEAALLVIDAQEGVQENSRRHGFMLSMLGIRQIVVLVNKMDLVDYDHEIFQRVIAEFQSFLDQFGVQPLAYVPVSAREGFNLVRHSSKMPWYDGPSVLELIDSLNKEKRKEEQPFRLPVQDIYKFTEDGDNRRIIAGTVETGKVRVGDEVVFLPSQKRTFIRSIEGFNALRRKSVGAGRPAGFTVSTQVYIKPGEIMCRADESPPYVGSRFRANIFWLGRHPMIPGKRYKLKIATNRAAVYLREIVTVLDASDLTTLAQPSEIARHDVAECILQTAKPIAFDLSRDIEATGRFVIIDDYEIVGGGIITERLTVENEMTGVSGAKMEIAWEKSAIPLELRTEREDYQPKLVVFTGGDSGQSKILAKALECELFSEGKNVFYIGQTNLSDQTLSDRKEDEREELIRRLAEMGRMLEEAGMIVVTAVPGLDDYEADVLKRMNEPFGMLTVSLGGRDLKTGRVLQIPAGEVVEEAVGRVRKSLSLKSVFVGNIG